MESSRTSRRKKEMAGVLILLVVGGAVYGQVLSVYTTESESRGTPRSIILSPSPDRLDVFVTALSVDYNRGDMIARVFVTPKGTLAGPGGFPAQDLKVYVNSVTGGAERAFAAGKPMNPFEVTLELYGDEVTSYPFDRPEADFAIFATSSGGTANGSIPIFMDVLANLHGIHIVVSKSSESNDQEAVAHFEISRGLSTTFFAMFAMITMWLLTFGVAFVTGSIALRGRKVELALFSFFAALLFAFPALRNAMPGAPPIGSLSDFLAFFWAESIVAICLLTIVAIWVGRPQK